jgi:hypothetical protein
MFLIGFDKFRLEEGRTQQLGDDSFEKNLYRHPSRQGLSPENDYMIQHDIYSLGVCLLEIGPWHSSVKHDAEDQNLIPSSMLDVPPDLSKEWIKQYLLISAKEDLFKIAGSLLPEHMGTKYAEVGETCLDPHNADFGDSAEFKDEDGIRVGVRYIPKVYWIFHAVLPHAQSFKILHRLNILNVWNSSEIVSRHEIMRAIMITSLMAFFLKRNIKIQVLARSVGDFLSSLLSGVFIHMQCRNHGLARSLSHVFIYIEITLDTLIGLEFVVDRIHFAYFRHLMCVIY